ncbi:domain containing [Chlorella sorokiniana]|uniref:Domain containing n=1 Tax=Chlorella sorokiniana TaxID=3076 RepID=A0A2P6U496_CHLSO|nr:domain containing [Chlorella sorokiniana]|eukprot:PRW61135.1 domain containing [Chlorella sorokiniana]
MAWLAAAAAAPWRRPAAGGLAWARCYSSSAVDALLQEYEDGRAPQVVPFEIGEEEARRKFLAWQAGRARLAPLSLLPPGGPWRMRPALLPFWLFDVRARVEYAGSVGMADKHSGSMAWWNSGWKELPPCEHSWQQDAMLRVYASYKYRRDYAQVVNSSWALKRLQPLPLEDARRGQFLSHLPAGSSQAATLDMPALQQAIAWELVLRNLRETEQRAAEQRLLASHGAAQVRDVHARLHVLEHSAQLAFLPAFHLEYEHGESFNAHGERVPAQYEAIIAGTAEGGVAGTRKYSAHKAGGGLLLGAVAASAAAAPLLGIDPWSLVNIETAFALASASSLAGLSARMLPVWLHVAEEGRRLRASDAEFERVVSLGVGPLDTGTDEQEDLRSSAEWRRWEHVGSSEPWREHKRQIWAEELLESQQRRRLERQLLRDRLQADRERQEEEERREERRRARWGHSSHHHHWQRGAQFSGGVRGGGRADYLGFYRLLGLEAASGQGHTHISQDEIKRAFRRAALRWHPDKQEVADEAGRRAARERFQQIRAAYETLRDPERRRAYDRGEAVDIPSPPSPSPPPSTTGTFADPHIVSALSFTGAAFNATAAISSPVACSNMPAKGVVYRWASGSTAIGMLTASTCGLTNADTSISILSSATPTGGPFTCEGGNDDAGAAVCTSSDNDLASTVSVAFAQNKYYFIVVGVNSDETNPIRVSVTATTGVPSPPPPSPAVSQSWEALGATDLSSGEPSALEAGVSAGGNPVVVVSDTASSMPRARVLEWSGSAWSALGGVLNNADDASLAVGSGNTYVAFVATDAGNRLRVSQLSSGSWSALSTTGLPDAAASGVTLRAAADGTLYLACSVVDGSTGDATSSLYKHAAGGTTWQAQPALTFEVTTPLRLAADGVPLLLGSNSGGSTCVMKLSNGAWAAAGPCSQFDYAASPFIAVAPTSGTILVSYTDVLTSETRVISLGPTSYTTIGGVLPTSSDLSSCQLVAHSDSKLAVACLESSATQPAVLLYDGSKWTATPTAGLPAQAAQLRLASTPSGTLFTAYSDPGASGAAGADKYLVQL